MLSNEAFTKRRRNCVFSLRQVGPRDVCDLVTSRPVLNISVNTRFSIHMLKRMKFIVSPTIKTPIAEVPKALSHKR